MLIKPPHLRRMISEENDSLLKYNYSGEVKVSGYEFVLGTPRKPGNISNAFFSVLESGKDDTNALDIEVDIKINGTSCLTTKPKIAHTSGEDSEQRTTITDEDDGVTIAVIDGDANAYEPGDIITGKWTLTRTATPTTEIQHVCVVVELMPD